MWPGDESACMAENEGRVSVQTYVTPTQRDTWRTEAAELDMSNAEYVRTMVQAGRRSFDLSTPEGRSNTSSGESIEHHSSGATPGVDGVKDRVLDVLRNSEFADWDTLLAGVTDDIEGRLEGTLEELQAEDRVRYSGRHGGYTVTDDER